MTREVATDRSRARWTRWDGWAIALVTLAGGVIRCWHLTVPKYIVFDEYYYAQDACVFVKPPSLCGIASPLSEEHPLLAKWLIAAGIKVFGYAPFGWRVMPVVVGIAGIALTYLLARRLLRSTVAAALAAGLLAVDGMHFVLSRTAMLDGFVTTFAIATILFVVLDRDRERHEHERVRDRPWLAAAGVADGAAVASKWSGIPFLLVAILLVIVWDRAAARERGSTSRWGAVRADLGPLVVWLVMLPLLIYVLSFAGRLDGRVLALPWDHGSWAWAFLRRQVHILTFHTGLNGSHPYESPAWSWPLLKRPVVFEFNDTSGSIREILAIGNPVVWWGGSIAAAACAVRWVRARRGTRRWAEPEGVILAGVAAGYLWWLPVTSERSFSFIFYFLPAVPFLCIAIARVAQRTWSRASGRAATAVVVAAAVGWFVYFLPMLTFRPMDPGAWNARIWFSDCRPEGVRGDPPRPLVGHVVPPPSGWCWR